MLPLPRLCSSGTEITNVFCKHSCLRQDPTLYSIPLLRCHHSRLSEEEWGTPAHCSRRSVTTFDIQVSRTVSRHTANCTLSPLQLGVSVNSGCEVIIHSVTQLLSSTPPNRRWMLFLNFRNAFNSINREAMFVELCQRVPGIAQWMEACYSTQPLLHLGSYSIRSCCGVQQGGPLGTLGFAITLQSIVEQIKAEVPNLTIDSWFLDDGTLMGSAEDLAAALNIVEAEGLALGLYRNRSKSLLFIPQEEDPAVSSIPSEIPITRQDFTLLGCPIGPPSFCEASLLH